MAAVVYVVHVMKLLVNACVKLVSVAIHVTQVTNIISMRYPSLLTGSLLMFVHAMWMCVGMDSIMSNRQERREWY